MADAFGRKEVDQVEEAQEKKSIFQLRKNSYQRHFEDYIMRPVLHADGKTVNERIYIGDYYRHDISDSSWRRRKVIYILIYVVTAVLFALESARSLPSNETKYCAVLQLICIVALIRMLYILMLYITAPRRLTIGEYKESIRPLRKNALVMAAALVLLVPALVISLIISRDILEVSGMIIYAAAAACMYGMYYIEDRTVYKKEENPEARAVNQPGTRRI